MTAMAVAEHVEHAVLHVMKLDRAHGAMEHVGCAVRLAVSIPAVASDHREVIRRLLSSRADSSMRRSGEATRPTDANATA